jgi:hypothetical protein
MIEVGVSGAGLEAVDVGKNEVRVSASGWEETDRGPRLDRRVDAIRSGITAGLAFPEAAVSVARPDDREWWTFDDQDGATDLEGAFVVKIELPVVVFVAAEGPGRLVQSASDGMIHLDFEARTPVTVGFHSRVRQPRETVTVERSVAGVRRAIRWLAAGVTTDTPDKSFPGMRAHPPAIEFGDHLDVPRDLVQDTTFSDITVEVPESLGALLVSAPLSFYLQADVRTASNGGLRIEAPTLDGPLHLGRTAPLERDVAALLQRVFHLDCLARNAGPYGVDLREFELLAALDLDAESLYDQSTAERLASYLRADYSAVADRLPDWHLSVVEPTLRSVRALPYLLDRLSLIQLPDPRSVTRATLVSESVDVSFASGSRLWDSTPTYDLVRNRTRLGQLQGWLAAGTPADAFRATVEAFENRSRYHERGTGPRRVVVAINDMEMLAEREAVEHIYRSRSEELSIDVSVVESLSRDELADLLRSPVDFLHFIGHCDETGLRCRDGSLSTATLDTTDVQTFFLNACGSFDQGLELVRRGSVAGAVTLANVLNPEASRVGMTFARLVMHGFSISQALSLAGRQSLTNKFYSVVGDGSHRLAQGEDTYPAELAASQVSTTEFELQFGFPQLNSPGGMARPRLPPTSEYVLRGGRSSVVLDRAAFVAFLASVSSPVVYENEFYWSTELADRLGTAPSPETAD